MTEQWLDDLDAMCRAATPGPWWWETGVGDATFALVNGPRDKIEDADPILMPESYCRHAVWLEVYGANRQLIAAAPTAIPRLIAMVRELEDRNARLSMVNERITADEILWTMARDEAVAELKKAEIEIVKLRAEVHWLKGKVRND